MTLCTGRSHSRMRSNGRCWRRAGNRGSATAITARSGSTPLSCSPLSGRPRPGNGTGCWSSTARTIRTPRSVGLPPTFAQRLANDEENFGHVFDDVFQDRVYERVEDNAKFLQKFADDAPFKAELTKLARRRAYEMIRRTAA